MTVTVKGALKKGLKIGEKVHKDFEIREGTAQDIFDAEDLSPPEKLISFQAALICVQLVRIGDYEGPFTLALLGKLSKGDMHTLRRSMEDAEKLGEGEQPGASTS